MKGLLASNDVVDQEKSSLAMVRQNENKIESKLMKMRMEGGELWKVSVSRRHRNRQPETTRALWVRGMSDHSFRNAAIKY